MHYVHRNLLHCDIKCLCSDHVRSVTHRFGHCWEKPLHRVPTAAESTPGSAFCPNQNPSGLMDGWMETRECDGREMKGNKWVISQREFQQSILQAIRVFPAVSTGERRRRICPDERARVSEWERERDARSLCALCLWGLRIFSCLLRQIPLLLLLIRIDV